MSLAITPSKEDIYPTVLGDNTPEAIAAATKEQRIQANKEAILKAQKSQALEESNAKLRSANKQLLNKTNQAGMAANADFSSLIAADFSDPNNPITTSRFTNPTRTFKQRLVKMRRNTADVGGEKIKENGDLIDNELDTYREIVKLTTPVPALSVTPSLAQLQPMKAATWTGIDDVVSWKIQNFKTIKSNLGTSSYMPFLLDSWSTGHPTLYSVGQGFSATEAFNNAIVGYTRAQLQQQQEQGFTPAPVTEPSADSLKVMAVNLLIQQILPSQAGLQSGPTLMAIFDTIANKDLSSANINQLVYSLSPGSSNFFNDPTSIQFPVYVWIGNV